MDVTREEMERAAYKAVKNHMKKAEVRAFLEDWDENIGQLLACVEDKTYKEHISYRKLEKTNKNGKERKIDSPTLVTRILQYLFIGKVLPLYEARDNMTALNCKKGCGLNAGEKRKSVRHRVKTLFYDRRDINYVAIMDQRKCYEHVRPSRFRKAMKELTEDRGLTDYGCDVTFVGGRLPIGTPVSPLAHHILMLRFDLDMEEAYPFYLRYADNIMIGCNSREEAHAALWRVRQRWWYELGIRANRRDSHVTPVNGTAIDYCGTVYHRNPGKGYGDHDKGYATVRQTTAAAARKATARNWGCYFGQLVGIDTYHLLLSIQRRNMKLTELTSRIRLKRKMDAPQVQPKEIEGRQIDVLDYEIRHNGKDVDNWVKLLISLDEYDGDGSKTGRKAVREMHGDYRGIIGYLRMAEKAFGKKSILPIEEARIVNSCGYIFEGSTEMMNYLDDYLQNQNERRDK